MQNLAISASRDGFRRAGRTWGREATLVAAGDLDDAQLEMLRADPNITVTPVAPGGGGAAAAPPAPARTLDEALAAMPLEALRGRLVRRACAELDPADDGHFTAAGLPATDRLETLTGLRAISAAERDAAWADHQASGGRPAGHGAAALPADPAAA